MVCCLLLNFPKLFCICGQAAKGSPDILSIGGASLQAFVWLRHGLPVACLRSVKGCGPGSTPVRAGFPAVPGPGSPFRSPAVPAPTVLVPCPSLPVPIPCIIMNLISLPIFHGRGYAGLHSCRIVVVGVYSFRLVLPSCLYIRHGHWGSAWSANCVHVKFADWCWGAGRCPCHACILLPCCVAWCFCGQGAGSFQLCRGC